MHYRGGFAKTCFVFQRPKRPFRRMAYTEALDYLREHNITKDDGSFYEFGDVSFNLLNQKSIYEASK